MNGWNLPQLRCVYACFVRTLYNTYTLHLALTPGTTYIGLFIMTTHTPHHTHTHTTPLTHSQTSLPGSRSSSEEPQGHLMRALYDYSGSQEDDLCFNEGDLVRIMYEGKDGWAEGLMADKYGYVPIGYFEPI